MEYIINVLLGKDYFSIKNAYLLSRSFHCLMLCVFMCFSVKTASVSAQTKPSDSETQTLTVKEALEQVKNRLEYSIWFNVQDIDLTKRVVVKFHNRTVNELLDVILKDQPLSYQISGKVIQIFRPSEEQEKKKKQHVVMGVVSDAKDGEPLIGCTVRIKGQSVATITDIDGNYVVEVGENDVLVFSYIGYETMQKMPGASGRMNIQLANSSTTLDDVIVTGYQVIKKYNVTGAVNTISSKEIDLRSSNTLQGVLEGAVPGLTVYNNQFRIRGGASLAKGINNLDVNNKPLFIVDDFEVEELPENMDMVETITVLKDAAAAAIWGSRAANGVVVITTKKGKANEFRISYSGNVKVSKQPNYNDLDRVNSEQLVSYDREAFMGGYYFPGFFDYSKNGYSLSQEIIKDYLKEDMGELTKEELKEMDQRLALLSQQNNRKQIEDNLLRNAMQHHHMLSISGGSDKVNYFLSGSFIGGHSSYVGDSNQSININSRTSYRILPFMTLRSDINATFVKNNNGYTSLASDIYNLYPFQMLLDADGNRVADYGNFNHEYAKTMVSQYGYYDQGKNLLDEIDLVNNKTNGVNYKVRVGGDFKIMNGLSISADYQYEKSQYTNKNVISKESYDGRTLINSMAAPDDSNVLKFNLPNGDILDHQQATTDAWILKLGATLNRSFGADKQHYVNAVAGFELRSRHYYTEKYRKMGYDDQVLSWQPIDAVTLQDGIPWWNGETNRYYSTSYDGFGDILNKEISYFGSALYTYDGRYTLSASMRLDKSNFFGASNKYRRNPIWALGANWNVKNEKFFTSDFISALMLRASWGLTGNFDRSGGTTPVMVGKRSYLPATGDYVVRLSTPPNPKLRWERNRSLNISVDLGLIDRINATLTYYNNFCYDLLGNTLLDPTVGYTSAMINAADMHNRGLEVQLGADILKFRNFSWNVNWIFGYNSNKVTSNKIPESSPELTRVTGTTAFVEGYAREAVWSYRWAGLDNKGEPMVYDKEGNKLYDIALLGAEDLEYSGTYQPKYSGSWSTGFRYKNLHANFLFTYNFGHVFRCEYPSMDAYATSPSLSDKIARRWQKEGDEKNTDIACLPSAEDAWVNTYYRSNAVMYSSNSIRNGNMIRLREILFNYECPQSWLKHTPLRRLSLTAQFNNVWLWTKNKEGYDPEAVSPLTGALSFGQPFSFTAGVKVDF
ncbi:SusC/RagA family TonB-linked outer membrane protein [Bacteroides reticulotermitis]|uniref:SusC/RagA family TonB-linked outer membrane protein n=1 Tax=Bacteroides reticulotermitis TaxID=1133319 RepID=UPI003A877E09